MSTLQRVYEPIRIGRVTIPNRIVRTAHGSWISQKIINDDLIAYHVARAKGGAGLSYVEMTSVHPSSYLLGPLSWDDSLKPSTGKLVAAVQPHGMKMFIQLAHGGFMYPPADGSPAWAASATANPLNGVMAVPMSRDQIAEIVAAFAAAAKRSEESGLDGCEIHGGHGYLLHEFMSPLTNRRSDEYGGSLENRIRFTREVLRAMRAAVAEGFPIGMRLSDQLAPGGLSTEECATIAGLLEDEGLIDFINGSQGSYHSLPHMLPGMDKPTGSMLSSSSKVVAGVKRIPRLLTAARVRTLEEAEQLLREGLGDMIGMNRAFIADPDVVRKTREGRADEVRPCIACNQGCVGGLLSARAKLGCAINVAVAAETTLAEDLIVRTAKPKKVLVIGGGAAGMEAARVAALKGHDVVLAEAGATLGGAANIAKLAPRMHTFGDVTNWLEREIYRLGVQVRTNAYMERDDVLAEQPDAVIVATGGMPRMDGVQAYVPSQPAQGVDQPHVINSTELLTQPARKFGTTALVFDDIGHYEAVGAAEFLIEKGVAVTFATRCNQFAPIVETWTRAEPALERLLKGDFRLMTRMHLREIRRDSCVLRPLQGERDEVVSADLVVLVLPRESLGSLHEELKGRVPSLALVGDARSPRDIQAAILEGHMAARAID